MGHKKIRFTSILVAVMLCALIIPSTVSAIGPNAIRDGFDDITLPPNDDGSTDLVEIGFEINFFGSNYNHLWVNNNGNLTFDGSLSTFTPFNLYTTSRVIIAPFFADVDTRYAGNTTKYQIFSAGQDMVDGHPAFGATWQDVDYYHSDPSHTNRNYFQVLLIDRSDIAPGDFDIEFNYDQIQWEAGTASDSDDNGLGGFSARAGYSNGTAAFSYELPGSAVNGAFLDSNPTTGLIYNSMNTDQLGRYIFQVRGGIPQQAPVADANGPYNGTPGAPVTFDGSGSTDADGTIVSYEWAFGDGNTGSGVGPSNTYASPGSYTATLTVTDNDGNTDTDTASVEITGNGEPEPPVEVGGDIYPANKLGMLTPWIILAVVTMVGATILIRRHRTQS